MEEPNLKRFLGLSYIGWINIFLQFLFIRIGYFYETDKTNTNNNQWYWYSYGLILPVIPFTMWKNIKSIPRYPFVLFLLKTKIPY